MDIRIVPFDDVANETWDTWVESIPTTTHLHSSWWIGFCHARVPPSANHSFAVLDNKGEPIAICPLGVTESTIAGSTFKAANWDGISPGAPAIRIDYPCQRRRVKREVYNVYHEKIRQQGAAYINLRGFPFTAGILNNTLAPDHQAEALLEGYFCQVYNYLVVDLSLPTEDILKGMTKEQRKHIHQSERQGLEIREFRGDCEGVEEVFCQYQNAHIGSAGRMVRPQKSFDWMLDLLKKGKTTLFAAVVDRKPISFLYCGEFLNSAIGWSQANLDEFEKEHSPRHLLEYSAMLSYQRRHFRFYGLGDRWSSPQLHKVPSEKERSIAWFKERYGGVPWPDFFFERFLTRDLFEHIYQERLTAFLGSDYFGADKG